MWANTIFLSFLFIFFLRVLDDLFLSFFLKICLLFTIPLLLFLESGLVTKKSAKGHRKSCAQRRLRRTSLKWYQFVNQWIPMGLHCTLIRRKKTWTCMRPQRCWPLKRPRPLLPSTPKKRPAAAFAVKSKRSCCCAASAKLCATVTRTTSDSTGYRIFFMTFIFRLKNKNI